MSAISSAPTVIVGASVAGVRVVQALRARGFDRRIVLIDGEAGLPYDKPALSKAVLTSDQPVPPPLLADSDLRDLGVELRTGVPVTGLDPTGRRLITADGDNTGFAQLVVATGSAPCRLRALDGFAGVHYLRNRSDAAAIRRDFESRPRVVVVGGGFIGGEVASSARALGLDVAIVEAGPRILGRLLSPMVSDHATDLQRRHSVRVVCGRMVVGGHGTARIEELELDDGTRLPADLVVIGIGTTPATGWLAGSGLPVADGLCCDAALAVEGTADVWAVGDVARWTDTGIGRRNRTEHWTTAREQAVFVANAMTSGRPAPSFTTTGYIWSDQHGTRIQHVGISGGDTVTRSEHRDDGRGRLFVHYRGDTVVGATAFDAPREFLAIRRLLATSHPDTQGATR